MSGGIDAVLSVAAAGSASISADGVFSAIPDSAVTHFDGLSKEIVLDKASWITAIALEHALEQAGIDRDGTDPCRTGMVFGSALAGQLGMIRFAEDVRAQSPRFVSPIHFPQTVGNYVSGALARAYHVRGPNQTLACGAASGLSAVIEGARLLSADMADVVYAGGSDRLSDALALGLDDGSRRFAEGACMFVLERADDAKARGATIIATITPPPSAEDEATAATAARAEIDAGAASTEEAIVSCATGRRPGGIDIAHWIGHCFAALGAAAIAAAIGAASGREVPVWSEDDSGAVTTHRVEALAPARAAAPTGDSNGNGNDGDGVSALILADAADSPRAGLRLRFE
ncbi:MAG: hypothetical protein IID36_02775 [Planctomycetes bacterium]|nr:hypothetical protein [Planctomycetota bacterium]